MPPRRATRRTATLTFTFVAAIALGLVALAAPASAHVTVIPSEAPRGGFAKLTFRVPTEHATASTVSVEVNFPTDQPIASARTKPVAGWTAKVDKTATAVTKITWSGGRIAPGEFQEFDVSLRLPEGGDRIAFPSVQTYDNGEVARWIEVAEDGGEEPEHPAPVLTLTEGESEGDGGGDDGDHGEATATPTTAPADDADARTDDAEDEDDGSSLLPVLGLALSVVAIVIAFVALTRGR